MHVGAIVTTHIHPSSCTTSFLNYQTFVSKDLVMYGGYYVVLGNVFVYVQVAKKSSQV